MAPSTIFSPCPSCSDFRFQHAVSIYTMKEVDAKYVHIHTNAAYWWVGFIWPHDQKIESAFAHDKSMPIEVSRTHWDSLDYLHQLRATNILVIPNYAPAYMMDSTFRALNPYAHLSSSHMANCSRSLELSYQGTELIVVEHKSNQTKETHRFVLPRSIDESRFFVQLTTPTQDKIRIETVPN